MARLRIARVILGSVIVIIPLPSSGDWQRFAHQRDDYWKWRHSHSDAILKIDIR